MRTKLFLILTVVAAVPAIAQGPEPPGSASTAPPLWRHQHAPTQFSGETDPGAVINPFWGGYVVKGTDFTKVRGSWIVPTAHCSSQPNSFASLWVGLDGYTSDSSEQIGIEFDCITATPTYYPWYDFYPNSVRKITGMTVHPGDKMSATVSFSGSQFTISMTNRTTGKSFSKTATFNRAKRTSAEWIVNGYTAALTNFGKISFGDDYTGVNDTNWATDSAVTGPISDFGSKVVKLKMRALNNAVLAAPSALTTDGSSFKVTWEHY